MDVIVYHYSKLQRAVSKVVLDHIFVLRLKHNGDISPKKI